MLAGRTINVISLAGVAFAIGMTLDNSIVVLESIEIERRKAQQERAQSEKKKAEEEAKAAAEKQRRKEEETRLATEARFRRLAESFGDDDADRAALSSSSPFTMATR